MSYTYWEMGRHGTSTPKGDRTYTKTYLVRSTVLDVGENDVVSALPVAYGDVHPDDAGAFLLSFDVKQAEDNLSFWSATCNYTSNTDGGPGGAGGAGGGGAGGGGGGAGQRGDRGTVQPGSLSSAPTERGTNSAANTPTSRPWVVKWGARDRQYQLVEDTDGTPIVSAAGQPIEGVMSTTANETLSITGFIAPGSGDHTKIRTYKNKVNNAAVFDYPAGWARCTNYQLTTVPEQGAFYWQFDIEIEFQEDGWDLQVMNAGTMYKESSSKPCQPIVDRTGHPITSPIPLKADGTGPIPSGTRPNFLTFKPYYEADFSMIF